MDLQPFFIEFAYKGKNELAEVKPCCRQNNVFYYDISMKNTYQFTITPTLDDGKRMEWKISLKNADKDVAPQLIELIGTEIEKHLLHKIYQ